jgi:uncharacterized membrane protein
MTASTWRVPLALIALGTVPIVAGTLRLVDLSGAADTFPADTVSSGSVLPLALHIVSAVGFAILGAFQFSAGLRRRKPGWHRAAGRLLIPLGLTVALSALWLNEFPTRPESSGELLHLFRLLFGSAMVGSIVLGFAAIRRRDVARHRAWMTRSYAIGLAAGTQVFTLGIGGALVGTTELSTALLQAAGWAINLAVAEWVIRPRPRRRAPLARRAVPVPS